MIDERLKNSFYTALKEMPIEDGKIRIRMEVSEHLTHIDKDNRSAIEKYLFDNLQAAVNEFKTGSYILHFGYGTCDDRKETTVDTTIICPK